MRTRAERLKAASNGGRALSDDEIRAALIGAREGAAVIPLRG